VVVFAGLLIWQPPTDSTSAATPWLRVALLAVAGSLPLALLLAWGVTRSFANRARAIASLANRYTAGDLSRPDYDYGADELATAARALDGSIQHLGRQIAELSRDRA
jgi:methyl-accepting chemotaxis protein